MDRWDLRTGRGGRRGGRLHDDRGNTHTLGGQHSYLAAVISGRSVADAGHAGCKTCW